MFIPKSLTTLFRNSNVFFEIRNSIFNNSGEGSFDAGIKLVNVINGILNNIITSENGNFGIILVNCSNIIIQNSDINDNAIGGIYLLNSDDNDIVNNVDTINSNRQYGIYLSGSDSNEINENTINTNLIGIYLNGSNYNNIINNDLQFNTQEAVVEVGGSTGNIFSGNNPPIGDGDGVSPGGLPLIVIYIIIGASIIAVVTVSGIVVVKKRKAIPRIVPKEDKIDKRRLKEEQRLAEVNRKEEERMEKERQKLEEMKKKVKVELQERLLSVDNLIKENQIKTAINSLIEIQNEAQAQELIDIVNEAEQKIITCKKSEIGTINRIKQTILTLGTKFTRLQLAEITERSGITDEILIESVISDMIRNKEIHGEYFTSTKFLALVAASPAQIEERVGTHNIFMSYSTLDADYFEISKIVRRLELYPEINEVLFWEVDSKQNIVEFMEETLNKTDVFVLCCSENSIKSKAVKGEWQSAYQMVKKGLMKIIPVYKDEDHIPKLLWQMLNVKYVKDDFEGFIQKLYEEILR